MKGRSGKNARRFSFESASVSSSCSSVAWGMAHFVFLMRRCRSRLGRDKGPPYVFTFLPLFGECGERQSDWGGKPGGLILVLCNSTFLAFQTEHGYCGWLAERAAFDPLRNKLGQLKNGRAVPRCFGPSVSEPCCLVSLSGPKGPVAFPIPRLLTLFARSCLIFCVSFCGGRGKQGKAQLFSSKIRVAVCEDF